MTREGCTSVTLPWEPLGAERLAVQWMKANELELSIWAKHGSIELLIPLQRQLKASWGNNNKFEFLSLWVPGETIRAHVWWGQREPWKTWILWGWSWSGANHLLPATAPLWEKGLHPARFVAGIQHRQNSAAEFFLARVFLYLISAYW